MRFLPCFAALALTTASLAPRIADACGGSYGDYVRQPKLALVSTHWADSEEDGERSFVVIAGKARLDEKETFQRLAPMSFDAAAVVERGGAATSVTLLGDSGRTIIAAKRRVVLSGSFLVGMDPHDALEVDIDPKDSFQVAILDEPRTANSKWYSIAKLGLTEQTTFDGKGSATVEIKSGTHSLGTFRGYPLGVLRYHGMRYLVTKDGDAARAYEIPALKA